MKVAVGNNLLITIIGIVDAHGNPTTLKSVPVWTSSDSTILPLTPSVDGMAATGIAATTGSVLVTATADGITASASIDVAAGDAVTFSLNVAVVPAA